MDHSEAVQLGATAKYLLGELPPDQREAFEEHFFDCKECAEDVRIAAVLVDNARSALREAPVPGQDFQASRQRIWWGWPAWGLAAAALLLAFIGYQNLITIPHLKTEMAAATTPQALTSFNLTTAGSRSATGSQPLVPAGKPFSFYIDIPASDSFAYYSAAVETESGGRKFAVPVSREQAKESVQILLPANTLTPGNYVLVVHGVGVGQAIPPVSVGQPTSAANEGTEVARYPFAVQ
jgi:Putative zinc-finger